MTGRGRSRGLLTLGAAIAILVPACSDTEPAAEPTSPPPEEPSAAELADRSNELLDDNLSADEPGCSAAVGIEGDVVWSGARGVADLSTGRAIDTSTTFAIASVSKQFTATAVLLLVQDGQLSLEDPLSRWLPDLPAWSDEVTVSHAVHHVSGIPDYVEQRVRSGTSWTEHRTQADTLAEIAAVEALESPPGTGSDTRARTTCSWPRWCAR
jgi:CubicO group peptidase (beta-lactamase class C family)